MSERNNETRTLNNNSEKLLSLINEFGSMSNIPDDQLEELGYIKNEDGGVTRKDVAKEKEKKEIKEKELYEKNILRKLEQKPFGLTKIELNQKKIRGKKLNEEDMDFFFNYISEFQYKIEEKFDMSMIIPQNNSFQTFKKEFEEYIDKQDIQDEEKSFIKKRLLSTLGAEIVLSSSDPILDFANYLSNFDKLDGNDCVSSEDSEKGINLLEKHKGTLSDESVFKKEFEKSISNEWLEAMRMDGFVVPSIDFIEFHKKNRNESFEEFMVFYLKNFIKALNYPKVFEKIKDCENFEDLVGTIKNLKSEDFPSFEKLKNIKQSIQTASIEEKKNLSEDKKLASKKLKVEKRIINGIEECLTQYKFIGPFFKKILNKFQAYLTVEKGVLEKNNFYLNGTPDQVLDKDPGRVSGDCTLGQPLPFDDPNVPIYNIKVFENKKDHVGNIYLFKTKEIESEKKCWHLDAIQIPSTIDWRNEISTFIKAIGEMAKKKNVDIITVNQSSSSISNYDYIQKAVLLHNQESGLGETKIDISYKISTEKDYSDLQGDGDVLIIWKNDEKK